MSGLLATVVIDGTTNLVDTPILLYTVPATTDATANMRTINNTANEAIVTSYFVADATPPVDDTDLLSPDTTLASKGLIEDTAIAMSAGETLFVKSSIIGVSFKLYGHIEAQP